MNIPFFSFEKRNQQVKAETLRAFEQFFDSAWYVLGGSTKAFEENYAKFNQVDYCVGVSNGLDALHLSLRALGIGKGDEVIVPSNTYIATVLAVSYTGATPVFVEPRMETANLNPDLIEQAITKRTKCIMPVHLYGQPCEMDRIMAIAEAHGLYVVEDNAQAHGATYNGKMTGSFGHINATSFYPTKNLGALGEAGAVTTNDAELAEKIRTLRNYGSQKRYYNEVIGYNNRIDEFEAAYLNVALQYLDEWTAERQKLAAFYKGALSDISNIQLFEEAEGAECVHHLFVIKTEKRDELRAFLTEQGIGTQIHYPIPPHLQSAYKDLGLPAGSFPIAEELAQTCLSSPLWVGMTKTQVDHISMQIRNFAGK
jgi:dTDP-4-amino-4,6-dideoxygalactose transaminase